ncbi:hypothetical protein L596_019682 [Steinernema carpocapsae]|uniref:Peptidase A1 domain-containing protein n=1 Tax=Steinernema carpocapsae TaxID=34508 RepID=A0A4U5MRS0_STECR|nr:hypothetical protein L596_019682 [Steinernema carpocapsae]
MRVLFLALFVLSSDALASKSLHFKLTYKRQPIELAGKHFRHNRKDWGVVTDGMNIGTPVQSSLFVLDTTSADYEVTLCPNTDPAPIVGGWPSCFHAMNSTTFRRISESVGSDIMMDDNSTFLIRKFPTFHMGKLGIGRHGAATPGLTPYRWDRLCKKAMAFWVGLDWCMSEMECGGIELCHENSNTIFVNSTSDRYWQIPINGIALGTYNAVVRGQAVIDTNTDYIGMPKKYLKIFTQTYGISWDGLYGAYTVECNATKNLPELNFKVVGGELTIRPGQYTYWQRPLDYCVTFNITSGMMGFTKNYRHENGGCGRIN